MAGPRPSLQIVLFRIDADGTAARVGHAAIHGRRGESPGCIPIWGYCYQPTLAAEGRDIGKHRIESVLKRLPADPNPLGELVRSYSADEILSRTGRRDGRRAVVGISTGANQGRIPDATPSLCGESAGRSRDRDMAVDVNRDGADCPIFHLIVEAAGRHQLFKLTTALRNLEPAVVDLLEAVVACEIVGPMTAQEHVRTPLE